MKFIPKYRYLKVGEKIRKTDKVLGIFGLWSKVNKTQVGLKVKKLQNSVRRKVGCDIFRDAYYEDSFLYGPIYTSEYKPETPAVSNLEDDKAVARSAVVKSTKVKTKTRRKKK